MFKYILDKLFPSKTEKVLDKNILPIKEFIQEDITIIRTPSINSENDTDFKLVKWFVKNGDIITDKSLICKLEINEMIMEYEVYYAGKITLSCKENDLVKTGSELCRIEKI